MYFQTGRISVALRYMYADAIPVYIYHGCTILTNQIAQNEAYKSFINLWLGLYVIYKLLP